MNQMQLTIGRSTEAPKVVQGQLRWLNGDPSEIIPCSRSGQPMG